MNLAVRLREGLQSGEPPAVGWQDVGLTDCRRLRQGHNLPGVGKIFYLGPIRRRTALRRRGHGSNYVPKSVLFLNGIRQLLPVETGRNDSEELLNP